MNASENLFRPVEGALIDLDSLIAIAAMPDRLLGTWLSSAWPGSTGLILSGLELEGRAQGTSPNDRVLGPPGTVALERDSEFAVISPGRAILTTRDGRRTLVELKEPMRVKWPTADGPAVRLVLALSTKVEPGRLADGPGGNVNVARERVIPVVGFVKPEQADAPALLPIAASTGNVGDRAWATDLRRVWQPEHGSVRALVKRLEALERVVWKAEPEGAVWDKQTLGRSWVRYQTVAASALQSARISLLSRATTTLDRVRLLDGLFEQLQNSVERAAADLIKIVGPAEGAGPYRAVGATVMRGSP